MGARIIVVATIAGVAGAIVLAFAIRELYLFAHFINRVMFRDREDYRQRQQHCRVWNLIAAREKDEQHRALRVLGKWANKERLDLPTYADLALALERRWFPVRGTCHSAIVWYWIERWKEWTGKRIRARIRRAEWADACRRIEGQGGLELEIRTMRSIFDFEARASSSAVQADAASIARAPSLPLSSEEPPAYEAFDPLPPSFEDVEADLSLLAFVGRQW